MLFYWYKGREKLPTLTSELTIWASYAFMPEMKPNPS